MHKFKFKELILFILAVVSLSGCDNPGQLENNSDAILASISAQNATFVTEYSDSYLVELSDKVSATGADGFVISNVRALSTSSECQVQSITQTGFTILADSSKACDYEYEAKLQNNTQVSNQSDTSVSASRMSEPLSDTAITRIAISRELPVDTSSVELSAISATTMVEQLVNINVKEQLLIQTGYNVDTGFTLSSEVALPYSEVIATVDPVANSISYTPPAAFEGIERILFSYINDTTGDVLLGTLDVVVAHTVNQGLNVATHIIYSTSIETNKEITIDVTPHVASLDNDSSQLFYVNSPNAAVAPFDVNNINNTMFTFQTSTYGYHYISFGVLDHNGEYALGLMEISVYDPDTYGVWDGIELNDRWFTPPLTQSEAINYNIVYNSKVLDVSYTQPVDLILNSYNQAKNACASVGALPSVADMTDLYNTDVKVNHDWPIIEKYFADDNGSAKVIDMTTGEISEPVSNVNYLVTCLQSTGYQVQGPTEDVVANAVDQAVVTFSLVDIPEGLSTDHRFILVHPIPDESIAFTTDSATAILSSSSLNTDADGNAQVIITSTKAEEVEVCGEVMSTSEKACFIVKFVADLATMEIVPEIVNNNQPLIGGTNTVKATMQDAYGNVFTQKNINITTSSSDDTEVSNDTIITDENGEQLASIVWVSPEINIDQIVTVNYSYDGVNSSSQITFIDAHLESVSVLQDHQSMYVGTNIVAAYIMDSNGDPREGVAVKFVPSSFDVLINGNSDQEDYYVITDSNGLAQANLTYGGSSGSAEVSYELSVEYGNVKDDMIMTWELYPELVQIASVKDTTTTCETLGYHQIYVSNATSLLNSSYTPDTTTWALKRSVWGSKVVDIYGRMEPARITNKGSIVTMQLTYEFTDSSGAVSNYWASHNNTGYTIGRIVCQDY